MTEPTSMDEYSKRSRRNMKFDGEGLDAMMHMPCPFCAAADFMVYPIRYAKLTLSKTATCKECGRSARAVFDHPEDTVSFEMMQTGGSDQPAWLKPKLRRISDAG